MSASSNPTRAPVRASATARFALIVDFPTPPFPDATATTLRTPGICRFPSAGTFAGPPPDFFPVNDIPLTSFDDFAVERSTPFDYSLKHDRPPGPTDGARRGADDGVGAPLPDPRIRPRRRDRLAARRHHRNGRLLRRVHDPRLPQLPARRRLALHHLHPDLRAVSGGGKGRGRVPLLLDDRHRDGDRHALLHRAERVPRGPCHPPPRPRLSARAGGARGAPDADRAPRADLLLPRGAPDGGAVRPEAVLPPRAGPPDLQRRDHRRGLAPWTRPRDGGVRLGSSRRGVPRELRPADLRRAARRPLLLPPARLLRPGPEGVHPALHPDHARLLPRRGGRVDHARLRLFPPRGGDHLAEQRAPPDARARGHLRPGVRGGVVPLPLLAGGGGEEGGDVEHADPHAAVGLPRLRRGGGHRCRPVAGGGPPRLPARGVHDRRYDAHRLRPLRLLPRNPLLVRPGDRLPRVLRDAGHLDADARGYRGVDRRSPAVLPPAAVVRRLRPRACQHGGDPPLRGNALRNPDAADGGAAGSARADRVREAGARGGARRSGGIPPAGRGFAVPRVGDRVRGDDPPGRRGGDGGRDLFPPRLPAPQRDGPDHPSERGPAPPSGDGSRRRERRKRGHTVMKVSSPRSALRSPGASGSLRPTWHG